MAKDVCGEEKGLEGSRIWEADGEHGFRGEWQWRGQTCLQSALQWLFLRHCSTGQGKWDNVLGAGPGGWGPCAFLGPSTVDAASSCLALGFWKWDWYASLWIKFRSVWEKGNEGKVNIYPFFKRNFIPNMDVLLPGDDKNFTRPYR